LPHLRRSDPTWADIVDAAEWLRQDLDISKSLWGEACLAMGRELAAHLRTAARCPCPLDRQPQMA
jgi:replication initiation protein RepC